MLFQLRVQTTLFVPEKDDSSGCSWRETETLLNSHMGFQVCLEKKAFSCSLNHLTSPLCCHCPFPESSLLLFFSWLKGEHWGEFEITAQPSCCHLATQRLPDTPVPKHRLLLPHKELLQHSTFLTQSSSTPTRLSEGTNQTTMKTSHIPIMKCPRTVVLSFELEHITGCKELFELQVEDAREGEVILFFKSGVQVNPITKQKIQNSEIQL